MLKDKLLSSHNSIIFDYGNGIEHMEYEATFGNYQLTMVIDNEYITIYGTDCIYEFAMYYDMLTFTNETYPEFQNRLNHALYYNLHEVEYPM